MIPKSLKQLHMKTTHVIMIQSHDHLNGYPGRLTVERAARADQPECARVSLRSDSDPEDLIREVPTTTLREILRIVDGLPPLPPTDKDF